MDEIQEHPKTKRRKRQFVPKKKFRVWMPIELYSNDKLDYNDKLLLLSIISLSQNNESYCCYCSNNYFADYFFTSVSKILNSLEVLRQNGFIRIGKTTDGQRVIQSLYELRLTKWSF